MGLALLLVVLLGALLGSRLNAADPRTEADPVGSGTLLLAEKGVADRLPAVRLGTDMDVEVSGQIARVRVTQAFRNTSDKWMEATYLYPLPEDGAVDSLKMVVGQRVIVGRIKRREEAREIYEEAKASGRKAGLTEQYRANMFRNSVANIGPGETVLVSIEYQAPVRRLSGEYALRLPLVVGPRYVPPHSVQDARSADDARAVTAPLADPALGRDLNPVSITVRLAPGFKPANIISPYHQIAVEAGGPRRRTVRLADGDVPADRDFELRWRSATADPTVELFRQERDGKQYVMATISPPAPDTMPPPAPREMIFVIDNSGSMGGESMRQAKRSLLHALDTLRPVDRFNIVRFDDSMTVLFEEPVAASSEQIAVARRFTESLEASGGTEMLPALKAALDDRAAGSASGLRQVIFLTDGAISNEREMLATLAAQAGRSRVFMVGIGSAPNNYLMTRMAEVGRGTYVNIGSPDEVTAKMAALLNRLKAPVARNLKVTLSGDGVELTPAVLPDLYAGEPLVLLGRANRLSGTLMVSGTIGDKAWTDTVDLSDAIESEAVARLWAKRRIDDIEVGRLMSAISHEDADTAIAELGLAFSIVTSQTSLVAVDETPTRPLDQPLTEEELPLLLPAGWDFDALFGGETARAAVAASEERANRAARANDPATALDLPQTATGFAGLVGKGLLLMLIGLAGIWLTRRRMPGAMA
ncbi:marine proteobacterial sortase target protein [Pelagerythrobacter aerophilus]|uniref:Marine proteobacterial sortase target protein n=1 Tax=Pelagerythrobacter aerophilus TaxID=2306995 RepID=A0A418NI05_9SPHN|nr:marine proteobacterial sortase target protein [Pelagerythrobacter aerophilus]RIV78158.1 marine proteobacterial sortase target protein [Pelagerythrobacter aerophilus]